MADLLIELFSEEIPARMQTRAADDLRRLVTDGLVEAGLTYAGARAFSTPRRLTLALEGLTERSADTREERKGPKVGAPDKAIEGFLRSTGLTRDQLEVRADKKDEAYFAVIEKPGRDAPEIVAEVLEATVRGFPWPKSMRWGQGSLRWVRPLHSILCLLTREDGAEVVPLEIDGIVASDRTRGHRFMSPGEFSVTSFEDYAAKLKRAEVVLDAQERAEAIWNDATNLAFASGCEVVEDSGLLAEVAGLVEWPVVLMGEIDAQFLDLPPEVLQTSMREHQKFFSVRGKAGGIERFITVANIETPDDGATILKGNQRVLTARLADAAFFWENDLAVAKAGMGKWTDALADVTFHAKLGSQADRVKSIAALAKEVAAAIGADPQLADQAANYAKADLASEMVYEFPELQGVMGRYYALEAGHAQSVALAAEEHYAPLGPADQVPTGPISASVAMADKIDILTGFWAIGEKPTGSKDPYALRRAALGLIRIILENEYAVVLLDALTLAIARRLAFSAVVEGSERVAVAANAVAAFGDEELAESLFTRERDRFKSKSAIERVNSELPEAALKASDLLSFLHDRLKVLLRDRGIPHDVIDACIAMPESDDLLQLTRRAEALAAVVKTDDGTNLVQGFKRASNILGQAEDKDGVEYSYGADPKFMEADEEKALHTALQNAKPKVAAALAESDFATAMAELAALRPQVDAFFEAVKINADSDIIRRNRLNLLSEMRTLGLSVADLTRLEG